MTNEVITGITGEEVSYMRPPFGAWQKKLEWELDVMPVMWTIDPLDWTTNNEDEIVNKVVTQAKENDIFYCTTVRVQCECGTAYCRYPAEGRI